MAATTPRPPVAFRPAPLREGRLRRDARRREWIAVFCSCLLAASLSSSTPARASGVSEANDLFARGRDLRLHGDCASAVPLFRRAFDVYPEGLGSLRNVAECEESLGHRELARQAWLDLGRALVANRDPKYGGWALDAERGAERLPVVESSGDAKQEVSPSVAVATPVVAPAPVPREPRHTIATREAGWAAVAVGGASLIGAGIALLVRQQALHDLPACADNNGQCPESRRAEIQPIQDRGHAAATLTDALGVVGLVGVASGIVLLTLGRPRSPDAALVVAPTGLFAAGRF